MNTHKYRAAALAGLFLISSPLYAHNHLESTTPADHAVMHMAPKTVELAFEEQAYLDTFELRDSHGKLVPMGFKPPINGSTVFSVKLPDNLPEDTYTVSWGIEGDDTHTLKGKFRFTVNAHAREMAGRMMHHDDDDDDHDGHMHDDHHDDHHDD